MKIKTKLILILISLLLINIVSSETYITSDYVKTNNLYSQSGNLTFVNTTLFENTLTMQNKLVFNNGNNDKVILFEDNSEYPFVIGTDYSQGNDFKINWGPEFYDDDDLFTIDWYTGVVTIGYGMQVNELLNATEISSPEIYSQKHQETITTARWYRFAETPAESSLDIYSGIFELKWRNSLEEIGSENTGNIKFEITNYNGEDNTLNFKILSKSSYATTFSDIPNIRVLMNESNNKMYLEFEKTGTDTFLVEIYKYQSQGWNLIQFSNGAVPTGYSTYVFPTSTLFSIYSDSATEKFNIDSNANLGIGQAANPSYKLAVTGNTQLNGNLNMPSNNGWISFGNGGSIYWNSTHTCIVGVDGNLNTALCR
ncbi:MAG: hypothetical protein AB7V77_01150 [Candidatus Woesearchaeota archaeon]